MLSKEQTKLLENVISTMDSFQQDYGKLHYSVDIGSYSTGHRIIVRAYNYDENKAIEFVIDETNEDYLYALFEQKTKIVLGEMKMFETESEEYADKYENNRGSLEWWGLRNSYQLGAAFGYDKAIKELETANEWNYVKDGDLPKHEVNVLVLFNEQCIDIAHYNWDYKEWHFTDSIVRDVIAWKEIILPEEIEQC